MPNLTRLAKKMALVNQRHNVSHQRVRYDGIELLPRPFIRDLGMNTSYKATEAIRDGIKRWEVKAFDDNLVNIDIATAFNDFDFGQWEISLDCGVTWLKTFLDEFPVEGSHVYHFKLGRGFTDANLTITYQIGQGTFTTVAGNPTEATTEATIYASVSQGRNRAQLLSNPSTSPAQIYLEGYFTNASGEPVEVPTDLAMQRPWDATLDVGNGATIDGQFTPVVVAENSWAANELRRGSTCHGYFTAKV